MKQLFLILLCVGASLCATAVSPRLNKVNQNKLTNVMKIQPARFEQSLQTMNLQVDQNGFTPRDFFNAYGLTPGDNRLSKKAPRRLSNEDILSTNYLDFRYVYSLNDDHTELEPNSYFYRGGQGCYWTEFDGMLYCAGLYTNEYTGAWYYIPVDIDYNTNEVMVYSGMVLDDDTIEGSYNLSSRLKVDTINYSIFVDSDWYLGISEDINNIPGTIYEDGSIVFNDELGYVFAGYQVINSYKRSGTSWNGYTFTLQTSDTTYFEEFYFNTQFIVPNAVHEYDVASTSTTHRNTDAYMYQYDDTTAVVFNLCGMGMPGVVMNIYPDGTMKYSLDQPIGEMGPYERKLYQDYYGSEYNWEYCRWYWPIAIEWDEAQQDYVEVEDEVIVGSVEPSAISWDAMEFYLPGIVQVSDGQYMALFSYPYINNVLMFTDGSEFVLDEPIVILRGDANNDGEVNIADVATLIDHILNDDFDDCDEFNSDASDTNLDGSISLIDVVTLIDYVLEGAWNN